MADGLDAIDVFISVHVESPERTSARITIAVYDCAWTMFFGGMSGSWRDFIANADEAYLVNKMGGPGREPGYKVAYRHRVIAAIQRHLRQTHADEPLVEDRLADRPGCVTEVMVNMQRSIERATKAAHALAKSGGEAMGIMGDLIKDDHAQAVFRLRDDVLRTLGASLATYEALDSPIVAKEAAKAATRASLEWVAEELAKLGKSMLP